MEILSDFVKKLTLAASEDHEETSDDKDPSATEEVSPQDGDMITLDKMKNIHPEARKMWWLEEALSLHDRRKRYKCKKFTKPEDIQRWSDAHPSPTPTEETTLAAYSSDLNSRVAIWHGDITTLEIDAVVNAANKSCMGGGGVDGCIHRAAGMGLYRECETLGGCHTGGCKITRGYNLPAKYVIHTVGPIGERAPLLESCYKETLDLARFHNVKTLAFCGISTGIYGYPLEAAAQVALRTVRAWLDHPDNQDYRFNLIIFVTFLERERAVYNKYVPLYFPLLPPATAQPAADIADGAHASAQNAQNKTPESDSGEPTHSHTPPPPPTHTDGAAQDKEVVAEENRNA